MATLQDAIDEIQAEVRTVAGMRAAPEEPPDSMSHFPFAVCYAREGAYRIGPPDTMHGIHVLNLEVHVARKDLERDIAAAMPFAKSVPDVIFGAYAAGLLTAVEVIQGISYEFGPMTWGGALTLGFRFQITGVKTQDSIAFTSADVPQAEADALIWLYDHTDGGNWTDSTNWLRDTTVGNWYGVTVSGGHVTKVDLTSNNLAGNIAGWAVDALGSMTELKLNNTSVSGDISGWSLPASMLNLYLDRTSVSGDVSGWSLPASLWYVSLYSTSVSGDVSSWTLPASVGYVYLQSTSVSGAIVLTSAVALRYLRIEGCSLSQADVDANLLNIYNRRASFTYATPELRIGGNNAAPGGTYQDGDPPTTGKEHIYEVCNDPETEGFNTWQITYNNDGGGDVTKP